MEILAQILELKKRSAVYPISSFYDKDGKTLELRIKANKDRTIEGYLAVWNVVDDLGTFFVRGAFGKSLQERGPESRAKAKIIFLWMHDLCDPIGQFTELEEDDYGLRFKALCDEIEQGERALIQTRSGTLNQFSIGFRYLWDKMEYDEKRKAVAIKEVELWEGSICSIGSNTETYAVRSKEDLDQKLLSLTDETEAFLRTVPRQYHLELRQLITKHKTLAGVKPDLLPLKQPIEPDKELYSVGSYNLDTKQFKQ